VPEPDGSGDAGEDVGDDDDEYAENAVEGNDGNDDGRQRRVEPGENIAAWENVVAESIFNTGLVSSQFTVSVEQPDTSPHEITATVLGLTIPEKEDMLEAVANRTITVDINGKSHTAYAWSFYMTTAMPATVRSYGIADRETPSIRVGVIAGAIAGGCVFGFILLMYAQWVGGDQGVIDVRAALNSEA